MVWSFADGHKIMIALDPTMGVSTENSLGALTLSSIHCKGYFYLPKIIVRWDSGFLVSMIVVDLHLVDNSAMEWSTYINYLNSVGIYFDCEGENLRWFRRLSKGDPIVALKWRGQAVFGSPDEEPTEYPK